MAPTAKRLVSGSSLRVFLYVTQVLVAFLMMPFVVHTLGDRMYGVWTLFGTFIGYYGLLDLGLAYAVNRHIAGAIGAGDKKECNRVFNTAFILYTGIGCVALLLTGVIAMMAPYFFKRPDEISLFWKVVLILGVDMAFSISLRTFIGVLTGLIRFDILSGIQLMTLVFRTISIVLVLISGYKLVAMALVTFISGLPGKVLYVYFSKKNMPFLRLDRNYLKWETVKSLFSYSVFAFIAQIADQLRFHLDVFVISAFISLSAVTHYRVASVMMLHFINLIYACMGVLMPVFSHHDAKKDSQATKKTLFLGTRISICLTSFVAFGFIAWGQPFIHRWMGPGYLDAYPCLVILISGCIVALWQAPSVGLLFGTSRHRFFALCHTIEGVFNLILSLILVRHYGLIGVALGTFFPMAIIKLLIQPIYVCRISSIQYIEYVTRMGKTIAVACISLIIPILISIRFAAPNYLNLFAVGLGSLCFYSILIWFFEFSASEKLAFGQAILPKFSLRNIQ